MFAESGYFLRFQRGELVGEVMDIGPALRRPSEHLPLGSREQIVRYRLLSGRTVAVVHQRAGDIFGNPAPNTWADPKYVLHNGIRYKFSSLAVDEAG